MTRNNLKTAFAFALIMALCLISFAASAQTVISSTRSLTTTAGSATLTEKHTEEGQGIYARPVGVKSYAVDWTSSSGGAVTLTLPNIVGTQARVSYSFTAGATQPTNLYDMTLKDADGFDVLIGTGANLTTGSAVVSMTPLITSDGSTATVLPVAICGDLTLAITNAGNAKSGRLTLLIDMN